MANVIKHKRGSGSDPVANDLVVGELAIRTDTGKLFTKMDSGALAEIAGGGSDIAINTLSSSSGTGGGSATFNGSAFRFTLSSPPSVSAQQLLVSINGVIQKPVAGTGQPSEGFSVDGSDIILGDAPETGSDFFILTFRSLGVSVPADNSVTSAKIADGAIVNADINASAAIAGSKISPNFGSQNIVTTGDLTVDTSTLHVDSSNNRVGISTTSPEAKLHVSDTYHFTVAGGNNTTGMQIGNYVSSTDTYGVLTLRASTHRFDISGSNKMVINSSGNVGISTANPTGKLSIASGTFQTTTPTSTGDDIVISGNQSLGIQFLTLASGTSNNNIYFGDTDDPDVGMIRYAHSNNSMQFRTNANPAMTIDSSGRVGIGTISPSFPLDVRGTNDTTFDHVSTLSLTGTNAFDSGDAGAGISFSGKYDSAGNITTFAQISGIKGNTATGEFDGMLTFGVRNDAEGVNIERMRITNAGRIGMGTTSPGLKLHVRDGALASAPTPNSNCDVVIEGTDNTGIQFLSSNQTQLRFGDAASTAAGAIIYQHSDNQFKFNYHSSGSITFNSSATPRMTIDSSGKLLVGTTTSDTGLLILDKNITAESDPSDTANYHLVIRSQSNTNTSKIGIAFKNTSDNTDVGAAILHHRTAGGSVGDLAFYTSGTSGSTTQRMTIDSSGNIGAPSGTNIFNASDSRVKTNIVDLDKGLTAIKSLRPVSFNWIDGFCDDEKNMLYGFIAQEVESVDSNLIQDFATELTVNENKIENVLRVNEKFIIPMLVKAIQELSAKVEALEAK